MHSISIAQSNGAVQAGKKQHEEFLKTFRFYDDLELNAYVREVGYKLAANSSMPELDWQFFIVDDDSVNAFATQGGYVYIHRGLMTYLTSEAQLAAVMSHEIAHITEEHLARQRTAAGLGKVMSVVASIAVWNSNVGEAVDIWNAARISGYGRDMELEADEVGAEYLYKSGYEPQAIIEVLSTLKDQQGFMSRQAGGGGYHGVFSSHPRSDERLKEVIAQAGQLPPGEAFRGRDEYRRQIDGLVFGENANANAPPGYKRFAHKGLGVTLLYPADWTSQVDGNRVKILAVDGSIGLNLVVERLDDATESPEKLIQTRYQVDKLEKTQPFYEDNLRKDDGRLTLLGKANDRRRVAVVKLGGNAYFMEQNAPEKYAKESDEVLLNIIRSFRRAETRDYPPDTLKKVTFQRLEPGQTFADLARESSVLGREAESFLRLINGYYPDGEAQPGTWIKVVK